MTVTSNTYKFKKSLAALGILQVAELAYVDPLVVKVNGTQYDIIKEGDPSSRQVLYMSSYGRFLFGTAFHFYDTSIFIMYQS